MTVKILLQFLKLPEMTDDFKKIMGSGLQQLMTILGAQSEIELLKNCVSRIK